MRQINPAQVIYYSFPLKDAAPNGKFFVDAPGPDAVVTAGFEFDVPVRFDTDGIQVSVASFRAGEVPNVPVVEVRI